MKENINLLNKKEQADLNTKAVKLKSKRIYKGSILIYVYRHHKNYSELDFLESEWINKLQETIVINKTIILF